MLISILVGKHLLINLMKTQSKYRIGTFSHHFYEKSVYTRYILDTYDERKANINLERPYRRASSKSGLSENIIVKSFVANLWKTSKI